jgi:hypothetical protein
MIAINEDLILKVFAKMRKTKPSLSKYISEKSFIPNADTITGDIHNYLNIKV